MHRLVGTCVLRLNGSIDKWYLKSALYNGVDLLDHPVTFEPGQQVSGIVVVLSDRRTELAINAVDEHGQPTREFAALVFSTDSERWGEGSRYIRSYVPMSDPRADVITGLPGGDYFAVAVDDIALDAMYDPIVLGQLASKATRVTIDSGDRTTLELRRLRSTTEGR
jgi:hypothetical protein